MKSAFELAMERLGGGPIKQYTSEQKEQLAEIDREFDARIAQVKLSSVAAEGETPEQCQAREEGTAAEIRRLEEKREERKESLRRTF